MGKHNENILTVSRTSWAHTSNTKSTSCCKTVRSFQTPNQQVVARQLDRSKRTRHSNIVKSTIKGASAYDKEQQHDIKDIEDRRS